MAVESKQHGERRGRCCCSRRVDRARLFCCLGQGRKDTQ